MKEDIKRTARAGVGKEPNKFDQYKILNSKNEVVDTCRLLLTARNIMAELKSLYPYDDFSIEYNYDD